MAQEGSPPRRSSRLPESGTPGRHTQRDPAPDDQAQYDQAQYDPPQHDPLQHDQAQFDLSRSSSASTAAPPQRRASRSSRPGREPWREHDPFTADDDLPPWAGPGIFPAGPGGSRLGPPAAEPDSAPDADAAADAPGGDADPRDAPGGRDGDPAGRPRRRRRGRAADARLRKSRRRVYILCGTAIVIAVIVAGIAVIRGLPKSTPRSSYVTTLQPGEYTSVPSACTSVRPALLSQYLPGTVRKITPASPGGPVSQCSFTVDRKPVFRVLEITAQAYQPSLIAAGNGSATANAIDTFLQLREHLAAPGKRSPLPAAAIVAVPGLGQRAVSALQVIHTGSARTDQVTVLVQDRNVLVTVSLQAQASGKGFGPVSVATVRAGALAASREVVARVAAQSVVHG